MSHKKLETSPSSDHNTSQVDRTFQQWQLSHGLDATDGSSSIITVAHCTAADAVPGFWFLINGHPSPIVERENLTGKTRDLLLIQGGSQRIHACRGDQI